MSPDPWASRWPGEAVNDAEQHPWEVTDLPHPLWAMWAQQATREENLGVTIRDHTKRAEDGRRAA